MTINTNITFKEFIKDKPISTPEEMAVWLYVYIEEQQFLQFLHGTKFQDENKSD